MTKHLVRTRAELGDLFATLSEKQAPFTVSIMDGEGRSLRQNRTINMWYGEIAKQLGDTPPETVRAQCKLQIGVPILRRDDAEFHEWYGQTFQPLPYATKLDLFERLEPAITSRMTVKQLRQYMDTMQRRYAEAGVRLTDPEGERV